MATMITGPENIERFRLIVLRQALQTFAKFKITPNRHLTPAKMLKLAGAVTGITYKRGTHAQAAADLDAILNNSNKGQ
jgi:hypothetical protein